MKEKQVFLYNQAHNTYYYFEKSLYNIDNIPVVTILSDTNDNFYVCYTTDKNTQYGYIIGKILPIMIPQLENNEITIYKALTTDPDHLWVFTYDLTSQHCSRGELYNLANVPQSYLPPRTAIIGDVSHIY